MKLPYWKETKKLGFLQHGQDAKNAATIPLTGGCDNFEVLMKARPDSFDAPNVVEHGESMIKQTAYNASRN